MVERVPKEGTQTKIYTQRTGRKSLANQNLKVKVRKETPSHGHTQVHKDKTKVIPRYLKHKLEWKE